MSDFTQPAYAIPLTDAQFALLGKIAAVFAQIDEFLVVLIMTLYGFDQQQFKSLVGDRMLSTRLEVLKAGVGKAPTDDHRDMILKFVGFMQEIVPNRNLVMHGSWGQFTDDYETFTAGPFSSLKPKRRFYVDKLDQLHQQACGASQLLALALVAFGIIERAAEGATPTLTYTTADRPPDRGEWTKGSLVRRVPQPNQD